MHIHITMENLQILLMVVLVGIFIVLQILEIVIQRWMILLLIDMLLTMGLLLIFLILLVVMFRLGTNPPTITTTKVTTKTTTKTTTTTTQPSVPTVKEGSLDKGDIDGSGSLDSTDVFYSMLYIANTAVGNTVKIS